MKRHWTGRLEQELRLTPYEGSAEDLEELIPQTVRPRDYRADLPVDRRGTEGKEESR